MTQGFPLSTTIFDVVVEAVVRHWILFVEGGAKDQDRRGDIFSYADDSLVASTDPVWLQGAFDTLTEFFNMVGLPKNAGKTVGMLCRPCRGVGTQSEADYNWQITEEGIV